MAPSRRAVMWLACIIVPVVATVVVALVWGWDLLIPVVASRASAALGRPVTIEHLHISPGPIVSVTADGLRPSPSAKRSTHPPEPAMWGRRNAIGAPASATAVLWIAATLISAVVSCDAGWIRWRYAGNPEHGQNSPEDGARR
jgi:hypothetical protein